MTLEDELRSALRHHADQVEPSANGLERIEARLAGPARQRPRLAPRLLAAAALLVAVGAVGAMTLRSSGEGDINVAISSSTTDPAVAAVINDLPPLDDAADSTAADQASSSAVDGTPAITIREYPPAPAGVFGPRGASPEEAVEAFLGLIQRGTEDVTVDFDADLARLSRRGESGEMVDVATLVLRSVEINEDTTKYIVTGADSPSINIDDPSSQDTNSGSTLSVTGRGEGFGGVVVVELYSSDDGVWLDRRSVTAGNFGELAPFRADLDVSGAGSAWVVVQSTGGTDTTLEPFAAVPVVVEAPRAAPTYLVTNIPAGDPGLVVRRLPGTDGEELGLLPPGQSGVNKRSALSVFIGDGEPSYGLEPVVLGEQEWWNVWLPEPLPNGRQSGWVNSRHLAIDAPVADADLEAVGWQFVEGLRGDDAAFAALLWGPDGVTFGLSNDLAMTTSGKAALPEFWQEVFSFTPPPEYIGTLDGSLRDVLSPTKTMLAPETAVDVDVVPVLELSPYSVVNEELASRFAGASVVQLTDPTNDGSGWRLVNLFVQAGVNGPEIVGMVAVEWTP